MGFGLTKQKGFIRNHQRKYDHCGYTDFHRGAHIMDMNKAFLHKPVHKKIGWSCGLYAKQFDLRRRNYCKHFNSKKCVADPFFLPHICWGFGHHLNLGGNQKFFY